MKNNLRRGLISLALLATVSLGIGLARAQEEETYSPEEAAYSPEEVAPVVEPVVPVSVKPTNAVQNIEIKDLPEKVRIIITTTQPAEYIIGKLYKPKMLYVDILNSVNDLPRKRMRVKTGPVKRIRTSQYQVFPTEVSRIVIDLEKWVKHEIAKEETKLYLEFYKPEVLIAQAPSEEKAPPAEKPEEEEKVSPEEEEKAPPEEDLVRLDFLDASMSVVLKFLAELSGYNIVAKPEVTIGTITIKLIDVPMMTALETILEMQGLWYTREKNIIKIMTLSEYLTSRAARAELTQVYRLQYAVASELATVLNSVLGGAVKKETPTKISRLESAEAIDKYMEIAGLKFEGKTFAIADKRTNSLIITTDAPENLIMLEMLIRQLDTEVPQVLVEVVIVDVTLTEEDKMGIQWHWLDLHTGTIRGSPELTGTMDWMPDLAGLYTLNLGNRHVTMVIQALASRNKLDVLSAPRILTLDNEEAIIKVGTEEPMLTDITYYETTNSWKYVYTYRELVTKLTITPQINPDKFVRLKLKQEVLRWKGEVEVKMEVGLVKLPIYDVQDATASMLVKDGHTVVMGGMITEEIVKGKSRVPVLGSIPLVGLLFRAKTLKTVRKELIMFATPYVITSPGEAREVTEREKGLLTSPPREVGPTTRKPGVIEDAERIIDREELKRYRRKKRKEKPAEVEKKEIEIPELEKTEIPELEEEKK